MVGGLPREPRVELRRPRRRGPRLYERAMGAVGLT